MLDRTELIKSFDSLLRDSGYGDLNSDVMADRAAPGLLKAIGSGAAWSATSLGDGTPIRIQNLDGLMTSTLFENSHLVMWTAIPKVPSLTHVYEWTRRLAYGTQRGGLGYIEGGSPVGDLSVWERNTTYVKFMGIRGGISHVEYTTGRLGGTQLDPEAEENRNRTLSLLSRMERWTLWGTKLVKDVNGAEVNWEGIVRQMQFDINTGVARASTDTNVMDLQGQPLEAIHLEEAAYKLAQESFLKNFDSIGMYIDGATLLDYGKRYQDFGRFNIAQMSNPNGMQMPGFVPGGYQSTHGNIPFIRSVFMDPVEKSAPLLAATNPNPDSGSPDMTSVAAPTVSVTTDTANSKFLTTDDTGTFYWYISACSDNGESYAVVTATSGVVGVGQKSTLSWNNVANATFYRVYRGVLSTGLDARFVGMAYKTSSNPVTFVDTNDTRPNTKVAVIVHHDPADIAIPMMSPLIRFPLSVTTTTIEFLYLIYATLVIKSPKRMFLLKNVGRFNTPA